MEWAIWAALGVAVVAVVGAASLLALRVLRAWRTLRRLRSDLGLALDRLAELGEKTSSRAGAAGTSDDLALVLRSLRASLARLAVLRKALDDATGVVGRLAWLAVRR